MTYLSYRKEIKENRLEPVRAYENYFKFFRLFSPIDPIVDIH